MTQAITRRQFVKHATASSTALLAAVGTRGFPSLARGQSLNGRLRIAAIGCGNRAGADIAGVAHEDVYAMADVDTNFLDQAKAKHPRAKTYRDFRVMLEKESDHIDAVVVGTPDHTHAPAVAMALRSGKHVYCEKPLTHTVHETRVLMNLAQKAKVRTQMGTQIHAGENYRQVVELIRAGIIGEVSQVHVWVNVGTSYSDGSYAKRAPVPSHLDWDLWLGPAMQRPYSVGVHPFTWRKFWDYGNGRLGDFGCHYLDLVHWALGLGHPSQVSAQGPAWNPVSPPASLKVNYTYPLPTTGKNVAVTWYGAHKPRLLAELKDVEGNALDWGSGQLFVGSSGMILSNYSRHHVIRHGQVVKHIERPEKSIPRSIGHHREWTEAIKNGGETTCNFDYAGHLTQAVLLGSVAYRTGKTLSWDGSAGRITNVPDSAALLHKEYRDGWTL